MKRSASDVLRIYAANPTISIYSLAMRIGGTQADYFFVRRLLRARGLASRGRDAAKAERNAEIRRRVAEGETRARVARDHRISKTRVMQIVEAEFGGAE